MFFLVGESKEQAKKNPWKWKDKERWMNRRRVTHETEELPPAEEGIRHW